jgi:general secretion pathway protein G
MVMTIIVILASTGVIAYQKLQIKAKETLLKDNLKTMRKLLDQYAADREELPQSLEDLVNTGYMDAVPVDPVTDEADWDLEFGDDPLAREGRQGVVDVHSKAPGADSNGTPFSDY